VESSRLSTGNHAVCGGRDLPRTSRAKCGGNLKAATDFKHGDDVVDGDALAKPKACRGYIDGALGVVQRLCRFRHSLSYAEYRDMPSERAKPLEKYVLKGKVVGINSGTSLGSQCKPRRSSQ